MVLVVRAGAMVVVKGPAIIRAIRVVRAPARPLAVSIAVPVVVV